MKKSILITAALTTALLAACGDDTTETKDISIETSETTEAPEETSKNVSFKDGHVKLQDYEIKISDTKVIPVGETGNEYGENPIMAVWFDVTNLTDAELDVTTAWVLAMKAVQNIDSSTVIELEVGLSPDASLLEAQLENIENGATVSGAISYDLEDLEAPVTIIAQDGIVGVEIGSQDFELK